MQPDDRLSGVRAKRRRQGGFTLLELLVVIAIIAMLMALLLAAIFRVNTGIRRQRARVAATALRTAIETYHGQFRHWPAPESDLSEGQDFVYGNPDGNRPNNRDVVNRLLDPAGDGSISPMLELKHFRVENGNVLDPWWSEKEDAQYRIQMDLTYRGNVKGRVRVWSVNQ